MKITFLNNNIRVSGLSLLFVAGILASVLALVPSKKAYAFYLPDGVAFRYVAYHSGKCMDVKDVSMSNLAPLQQYSCLSGQTNQNFKAYYISSRNAYQIRAVHSGKCLDIRDASTANGAQLQQYTCLSSYPYNQMFVLSSEAWAGGFTMRPLHTYPNKCVTVNGGVSSNGALLVQSQCLGLGSQIWVPKSPLPAL